MAIVNPVSSKNNADIFFNQLHFLTFVLPAKSNRSFAIEIHFCITIAMIPIKCNLTIGLGATETGSFLREN